MKIGLLRCQQTEDMCPASTCLSVMRDKKCAFEGVSGDISLIGITSCGGCPGKKAVTRAAEMVRRGADTIVLASCIFKGTPVGFPCPHAQQMKDAVAARLGKDITIIDYSH